MTVASSSMHQLSFAEHPLLPRNSRPQPRPQFSFVRFPSFSVRASSALAVEPAHFPNDSGTQKDQTLEAEIFSCPVCYEPLIRRGPSGLNLDAVYRSGFKCNNYNKSYYSKDNFLDLILTAVLRDYIEVKPVQTELVRSPLVPFLYERGWRQNFNCSGFPGQDEEVRFLAHFIHQNYL